MQKLIIALLAIVLIAGCAAQGDKTGTPNGTLGGEVTGSQCPQCNPSGDWSTCQYINATRFRTNYYCNATSNFTCAEYKEWVSCESEVMPEYNNTCTQRTNCYVTYCAGETSRQCLNAVMMERYGNLNCASPSHPGSLISVNNYTACDCIDGYCTVR